MLGGKGIPISTVVTEMRFDTDSATPKLTFKPVKVLEREDAIAAIEQGKTEVAIKAITMTVAELDGAKAPAKLPAIEADPLADMRGDDAPAPKAAKVKVEAVEEPTKRVKKEEQAAEKKDLSKILEEWDD
jgi:hypothetical protein